jgi:nucleobase:cation symporter-1, NCS1 family
VTPGVVFADRVLDRTPTHLAPFTNARHVNLAGPVAVAVAMLVSIFFFSNQQLYVGVLAAAVPAVGDITSIVGSCWRSGSTRHFGRCWASGAAAATT